jgi:hypothetical protein
MSSSRMTTRGLMSAVAVIGVILGLAVNYRWFVPLFYLLLLTAPQALIFAFCIYQATRGERDPGVTNRPASSGMKTPGGDF